MVTDNKDETVETITTMIVISDENNKDIVPEEMTNSVESVGTSQSLVSFSDATEDKSEAVVQSLPKEVDRVDSVSTRTIDDSDEERPKVGGIDIPIINPNTLSATTPAANMPKRSYHEGTQNYRKTLRLTSEQIVSVEA